MSTRYKVADLDGALLDAAVAKAEGRTGTLYNIAAEGAPDWLFDGHAYSRDWDIAGPIIAREQIGLLPPESAVHRNGGPNAGWGQSGIWSATSWKLRDGAGRRRSAWHDTSMLVAAMRLFVLCKLGDEVEL